jgi:N-methylhydantoinase A
MVRALRVMTVERGVDPRKLALMAFGGAGGLHAAAIAEELGISRMLCPRASGVLAALGLVVSERRRDAQRSVLLHDLDRAAAEAKILADRARAELGVDDANLRLVAELRYRGQAFELAVELSGHLEEDFHAAHEDAYGYRDPEAEVELVTLRATATQPGPEIDPKAVGEAAEGAERSRRDTVYGDTEIIRGEPAPGERIEGPAIVELREATLAVPPGWSGEVLESGTIRVQK